MREYVELGIGREARRTYQLRDISLVPSRRTRSSQDVDLSWNIDAYSFDLPFVAAASDALSTPEFVVEMGRQGGLAVINAEGLWGRHEDINAAVAEVLDAADHSALGPDAGIQAVQRLHAAELNTELLSERIRAIRDSGVTVAVRVSPQRARELADIVIAAGAELLFIQGTLISAEHVATGGQPLNLKDFISSLDVPVITGGVMDYTTALHLMRAGAAGVIVGGGANTNDIALGITAASGTAIADAAAARRDYLDETGGRYVHILADTEPWNSGDIARAIACGADGVILGSILAPAAEAAAGGYYWPSVAGHPRFPRGAIEINPIALVEDEEVQLPSLAQILHGPSNEATGTMDLAGGLRRAMAKCGYTDLKAFQKVELAI